MDSILQIWFRCSAYSYGLRFSLNLSCETVRQLLPALVVVCDSSGPSKYLSNYIYGVLTLVEALYLLSLPLMQTNGLSSIVTTLCLLHS